MKQVIASLTALFVFATTGVAQVDISFQNELQRSIDRGLDSLKKSQQEGGFWTNEDHPAVTAIVLVAYHGNPNKPKETPEWITKGHDHLMKFIQPDGSISVSYTHLRAHET